MLITLESLNYSFRNPKKHNLGNPPHQTVEKLQKNHGVLRGPQLGKQRWRARLGILRVKMRNVSDKSCRENQNTHFVFSNFFSSKKSVVFTRRNGKYREIRAGLRRQHGAFVLHAVFVAYFGVSVDWCLFTFVPKRIIF